MSLKKKRNADGTYCFDFHMVMTAEIFDFYHLDIEKCIKENWNRIFTKVIEFCAIVLVDWFVCACVCFGNGFY